MNQSISTVTSKDGNTKSAPDVLIFDVNETLIDFEVMNPLFERVFGDKRFLREWLGQLIMYSMTLTLSGQYKDYFSIGKGCLEMVARVHGKKVSPDDIEAIKSSMETMPAHADAREGLEMLKKAGFRLVSLTNSPLLPEDKTPLAKAGLADLFERQFSIESARSYKPAQVVYHMVPQELGVPESACCMVATHMWDTIGAQSAGLYGALLTRPGNASLVIPGVPQPHIIAADVPAMAREAAKLWR